LNKSTGSPGWTWRPSPIFNPDNSNSGGLQYAAAVTRNSDWHHFSTVSNEQRTESFQGKPPLADSCVDPLPQRGAHVPAIYFMAGAGALRCGCATKRGKRTAGARRPDTGSSIHHEGSGISPHLKTGKPRANLPSIISSGMTNGKIDR